MRHATVVLGLSIAACNFSLGSSTSGAQHHVTFTYGGCFFGCGLDQAMMLGTTERIDVKGDSIPAVSARSSSPSVVAVQGTSRTCCAQSGACRTLSASDACSAGETPSLSITLDALAEGTADLDLVDASDATFDSVTVTVRRPAALALTCDNQPFPLALATGKTCSVGWTATDASGASLMASSGVTLRTSDPKVFALETLGGAPQAEVESQQGFLAQTSVVAVGAGTATLSATADAVATSGDVHVGP